MTSKKTNDNVSGIPACDTDDAYRLDKIATEKLWQHVSIVSDYDVLDKDNPAETPHTSNVHASANYASYADHYASMLDEKLEEAWKYLERQAG